MSDTPLRLAEQASLDLFNASKFRELWAYCAPYADKLALRRHATDGDDMADMRGVAAEAIALAIRTFDPKGKHAWLFHLTKVILSALRAHTAGRALRGLKARHGARVEMLDTDEPDDDLDDEFEIVHGNSIACTSDDVTERAVEQALAGAKVRRAMLEMPAEEAWIIAAVRLEGWTLDKFGTLAGISKMQACRLLARADAELKRIVMLQN